MCVPAGSQRVASNSGAKESLDHPEKGAQRRASPSFLPHPLLAPASLKTHGPCSSSSFQATDEDSSQQPDHLQHCSMPLPSQPPDISVWAKAMVCAGMRAPLGKEGRQVGTGLHSHLSQEGALLCLPDALDHLGSCPTAPVGWSSTWHGVTIGSRSVSPISQIFELSFVASWALKLPPCVRSLLRKGIWADQIWADHTTGMW